MSGDTVTPTFKLEITPSPPLSSPSIQDTYVFIRNTLNTIYDNGLDSINPLYSLYSDDIFPFYFRPTKEFYTRITDQEKKQTILNNVKVRQRITNGLIWSLTKIDPDVKENEQLVDELVENKDSEQTFSTIMSDRIYFISTDTTGQYQTPGKLIDFDSLNKYDLEQEDYLEKIEKNTYATVRGDKLYEFLVAMYNVLVNHKHNICEPYARQSMDEHKIMVDLFSKLKIDLLNETIRIN